MTKQANLSTKEPKSKLINEFWEAHIESLLDRKTTAAGIGMSLGWMELKACYGGGPPYYKFDRRCLYKKREVLDWIKENSDYMLNKIEQAKG